MPHSILDSVSKATPVPPRPFVCAVEHFDSQRKHMKKGAIMGLKAIWGTHQRVLEMLQGVIKVSSHLSFAVRAPSHNDDELKNLDLLARDVVSSYVLYRRFL